MAKHTPVNQQEARTLLACLYGIEPEDIDMVLVTVKTKCDYSGESDLYITASDCVHRTTLLLTDVIRVMSEESDC